MTIHALLISQYKAVQLAYGENFDYFWVYLEEFGVFWGILSIFFREYWYSTTPPGRPCTVKKVKSYLKKLERNDVDAELEKNSHLKGNPLAPFEAHVCLYQQCETFYIELVYLLPNFGFLTLDYRAPNQSIFPLYFCDPDFFSIGQRFTFYMVNSSFYMVNVLLFIWSTRVFIGSS